MTARVLIVEDDDAIATGLALNLKLAGHASAIARDGVEALKHAEDEDFGLVLLDINLPKKNGLEVLAGLRATDNLVPVIVLSAREGEFDKVAALRLGADDYVTKPFALAELAERLRALLRRVGHDETLSVAGLRLDPAEHAVGVGGTVVKLTPTEFRLLGVLLRHAGTVVRRRALVEGGWPHGAIVHDNTLDAYAARLRRKLRELPDAPEITTVHGVGYTIE